MPQIHLWCDSWRFNFCDDKANKTCKSSFFQQFISFNVTNVLWSWSFFLLFVQSEQGNVSYFNHLESYTGDISDSVTLPTESCYQHFIVLLQYQEKTGTLAHGWITRTLKPSPHLTSQCQCFRQRKFLCFNADHGTVLRYFYTLAETLRMAASVNKAKVASVEKTECSMSLDALIGTSKFCFAPLSLTPILKVRLQRATASNQKLFSNPCNCCKQDSVYHVTTITLSRV